MHGDCPLWDPAQRPDEVGPVVTGLVVVALTRGDVLVVRP
jgi:hypothetical protein